MLHTFISLFENKSFQTKLQTNIQLLTNGFEGTFFRFIIVICLSATSATIFNVIIFRYVILPIFKGKVLISLLNFKLSIYDNFNELLYKFQTNQMITNQLKEIVQTCSLGHFSKFI